MSSSEEYRGLSPINGISFPGRIIALWPGGSVERPWYPPSVRNLSLVIVVSLLLSCAPKPSVEPAAGGPRHVVVLSFDTTRPDHFGFLGPRLVDGKPVTTPNLDALADESVVLPDCMTAAPTTLAAHTSLFTGNYPHRHGVPRNGWTVHPDNLMLPEILRDAGFHTAGFVASFVLSRRFGFDQGFAHWDEGERRDGEVVRGQRSARAVNASVIAHLDALDARPEGAPERLFLFVHYFDVHQPLAAPEAWETTYDARGREELAEIQSLRGERGVLTLEAEQAARYEAQYAAEISHLDEQVGRLLGALRERGVLDDAILLAVNDHGETFNERPLEVFDHGATLYQDTVHALCMVRLPGGEGGGRRIPGVASTIDLLPTLLERLEMPTAPDLDGESIRFLGGRVLERTRFVQATKPYGRKLERANKRWPNLRKAQAVRSGRYKLIQTPYLKTEELYDLEADPGETRNLLAEENLDPEIAAQAEKLSKILRRWTRSADPLPSDFIRTGREEAQEKLRELGYLQ